MEKPVHDGVVQVEVSSLLKIKLFRLLRDHLKRSVLFRADDARPANRCVYTKVHFPREHDISFSYKPKPGPIFLPYTIDSEAYKAFLRQTLLPTSDAIVAFRNRVEKEAGLSERATFSNLLTSTLSVDL